MTTESAEAPTARSVGEDWNKLSSVIRGLKDLDTFKRKLKTFYHNKVFI